MRLRCGRTIGLCLILLSAVPEALCSQQTTPAPATRDSNDATDATLIGTLDELWTFLERVEKTVSLSVSREVTSRLEGLQLQLAGHAAEVKRRLDDEAAEDSWLAAQISGLSTRLSDQVNNLNTRLSTEVSALSTRLSAQVSGLDARLSARITGLDTNLSKEGSDLANRLSNEVGDLSTRLNDVTRRLERLEAHSAATQVFRLPRDCSDIPPGTRSGIHTLLPGLDRSQTPVPAFCDLETDGGGWTVIQRRDDIQPRQDFYLGWQTYKRGFGELEQEFWWGLDNLWATTSARDRRYELRIDLEDFDGEKRHAVYRNFRVASEAEGYALTAVNYTGDAGDGLKFHAGMKFTTKDMDNDRIGRINCAQNHKGAWWYKDCHTSNLNGRYLSGTYTSNADGVCWRYFKGIQYSLKTATMKIRPTHKL